MFTKARLITNISNVLQILACVFSLLYFMVNFLLMILYNSSHYYVPYFLTTDDTDKTRKCGTLYQMRSNGIWEKVNDETLDETLDENCNEPGICSTLAHTCI